MAVLKKSILKKSIKRCKARIEYLERKRSRSQAALMTAILSHTDPNDEDVDYFNRYTALIDQERNDLHNYTVQLEAIKNGK